MPATTDNDTPSASTTGSYNVERLSPSKRAKTTLNDGENPNEPQPTALQNPGHYNLRERRSTVEREDSRHRSESARGHDPVDPPSRRTAEAPNATSAQPQAQVEPPPQMANSSSDDSWEYYSDKDFAKHEEAENAKAAPRAQEVNIVQDNAAPRHAGLPSDPRPSSNAHTPPPPPPQSTRPIAEPEMREVQAVQQSGIGHKLGRLFAQSDPTRDKSKEEYNRLYVELQNTRDQLRRAEGEIRRLRHMCREMDAERNRYKENAAALTNELRNVQRELDDSRTLSEIRGKELIGAQVFLTKADQLSASELCQKVNVLNEETFQASAWFSEILVHQPRQWKSEDDKTNSLQMAVFMIGEPAANILIAHANDPEPNFYVVQLVMQVCLTKFCSVKIENWHEVSEPRKFLKTLYEEIKRTEEQAVSGRWRALTHAHTRSSPVTWTNEFTSKFVRIMEIASWEVHADNRALFAQKLKPIFKAILDLRISLGEHFTSADIETFCPAAGVPFDPQQMENALDDGRGKGKDAGTGGGGMTDIVFGTPGLGLREVQSRETRSGGNEYRMVLQPKVIPQSALNELLQPAPKPPRKSKPAAPAPGHSGQS